MGAVFARFVMFILRSAFWLTVGFLVMAPHGTDFGAMATSLKDQAIASLAQRRESARPRDP